MLFAIAFDVDPHHDCMHFLRRFFINKLSLGHRRRAGERSGGRCPEPSAACRLVSALAGAGRLSERTPQAASAKASPPQAVAIKPIPWAPSARIEGPQAGLATAR
jgi:hypothetical protein